MYAIYGNIYHPYTPNVSIYTSTMDPMGHVNPIIIFVPSTELPLVLTIPRVMRLPPSGERCIQHRTVRWDLLGSFGAFGKPKIGSQG